VKPYTRHVPACPHRSEKDHNACRCPKWLYEYRRGGKPVRHTLDTPSWADALRIALHTLQGFDPEVAVRRASKEQVIAGADDLSSANGFPVFGYVYRVTHKKTGHVYIGQTTGSLILRWRSHLRDSQNGSRTKFHRALREYGEQSFLWETIAAAGSRNELNIAEEEMIDYHRARTGGFNTQ
jgi:hypothetical protein